MGNAFWNVKGQQCALMSQLVAKQIGLVLAIVAFDDVECGMQQAVDFAVLADGADQHIQRSVNRTTSCIRLGIFICDLDVFDLHFPDRFPRLWQ